MSAPPTHGGSDDASLLMALSARALSKSANEPTDLQPPVLYGPDGTSSHGFGARPLEAMQTLLPQDHALSKEIAFQLLTQGPCMRVFVRAQSRWIVGFYSGLV